MPDFLNKDPASDQAAAPPKRFPHTPAPEVPRGDEAHPPAVTVKAPSRIWTDYYGAIFLLIVAVFIGVGTFVLRPLVINFRRLEGTIASTATLLQDEQGYLTSVEASISAAQSIPPETLANVDEALPHDADVPKLLQAVTLFAKKENVTLSSVQFTAPPADSLGNGNPQTIDINMTVSLAGYAGLRQFLDGVEHSLRIFDMGAISVTSGDVGGNAGAAGDTAYSFEIHTYFLPPPPPSSS